MNCMLALSCWLSVLAFSLTIAQVEAHWPQVEAPEWMYSVVTSTHIAACPKIISGNISVGCEGAVWPEAGIVVQFPHEDTWTSMRHAAGRKFVVVLDVHQASFVSELRQARHTPNLVGVIVRYTYDDAHNLSVSALSDNTLCPNSLANNDTCFPWNAHNNHGNLFKQYAFPVFYTESRELIANISRCAQWNRDHASSSNTSAIFYARWTNWTDSDYCMARLYNPTYSAPAYNYQQCSGTFLRSLYGHDRMCEPLLAENHFIPLFRNLESFRARSVIVIASRTDSLSMFTGKSPAHDSVYTGLIATLGVMQVLAPIAGWLSPDYQIVFAFYSGESFDRLGSSYHVRYLTTPPAERLHPASDQFYYSELRNMTLEHIDLIIELNQISNLTIGNKLYLFSEVTEEGSNGTAHPFVNILRDKARDKLEMVPSDASLPFPPSVSHSFNQRPNTITKLLLANHQERFTNTHYHSVFDRLPARDWNATAEHLSVVADILASSLLEYIGFPASPANQTDGNHTEASANSTPPEVSVDRAFMVNLTHCILSNEQCADELSTNDDNLNIVNYDANDILYGPSALSPFFDIIIPSLLGEMVNCSERLTQKQFVYLKLNISEGVNSSAVVDKCLRYQLFRQETDFRYLSPGEEEYFFSHLWFESAHPHVYYAPKLVLYHAHSRTHAYKVLAIGLVALALSLVIVHWRRLAGLIFHINT